MRPDAPRRVRRVAGRVDHRGVTAHLRLSAALAACCLVVALALGSATRPATAVAGISGRAPGGGWHVLADPINPDQLLDMPFGTDSPWLQPWRASLTTRPAAALLDAIGINFNVAPNEAMATARLLHASGFRRARIEVPWNAISYADPSTVADPSQYSEMIAAMRRYHLRPLILLNANSLGPGPTATSQVIVKGSAARGARTVAIAPGSQVVPGLTGFDTTDNGYPENPGDLIESLTPAGVATLSRPLPMSLPAGAVTVSTLRYAPFQSPRLADGRPNPAFEATLRGWLRYAKTVVGFVRGIYGSSNFDVEVWNELTFGSAFLDEDDYYNPLPDPGGRGDVDSALLAATAAMLHDPANGFSGIEVGDGFANEDPWSSGANVPGDVNAIDKHPYSGSKELPTDLEPGIQPLNALGRSDGHVAQTASGGAVHASFYPRYRVFMPEYFLTGIQTETLMRDLSPRTTMVYDTPHGARVHQPGSPPPSVWITEDNLDQTQARANGMRATDIPEMQAKAALRLFVAYASEGVRAIDLYGAQGAPCCQIIPQAFFDAVDADPSAYPGALGGPTMTAVRRLTAALAGGRPIRRARQLTLSAVGQLGDAGQFHGNDTAADPSLYNRDVLAFFPFQVSAHRFVSAVYVMTSDISHRYTDHPAPGATPYDLPAEQFRLTIGDVDGMRARVSLSDPLTGARPGARIVARSRRSIVVQLPATDSPRLLTITD
jgi:hypothetical protein